MPGLAGEVWPHARGVGTGGVPGSAHSLRHWTPLISQTAPRSFSSVHFAGNGPDSGFSVHVTSTVPLTGNAVGSAGNVTFVVQAPSLLHVSVTGGTRG